MTPDPPHQIDRLANMSSPAGPPQLPLGPAAPPQPDPRPLAELIEPKRAGGVRLLLLTGLIVACALAAIGIVTYVGWKIGTVAVSVGIAGALLPVPVLVGCFIWLDRYDPSPTWIMLVCFLWGAGPATTGAYLVNSFASKVFESSNISDDLVGIIVAPFIEELLKALFPLLLFAFYRKAFTGVIDGVVYCGLSATGFAMVENILYLGGHGYASEAQKGFAAGAFAVTMIFILRVPLSGFAHPLFTSLTGVGLGIAARTRHVAVRVIAPFGGLLLAMLLHSSWNLMATLSQDEPFFILYGYFAVFVPIFFAMVGYVLWARSWEGRLAERVLPAYAMAGWFSPPEIAALATLGRRLAARTWARKIAGETGQKAMRAYQFAATRLALVRDGLDRGLYASPADLHRAAAEEHRLLSIVERCRTLFTTESPTSPTWWRGGAYHVPFPDGVTRVVPAPPMPVVPVAVVLGPPAPVSGLGGPNPVSPRPWQPGEPGAAPPRPYTWS